MVVPNKPVMSCGHVHLLYTDCGHYEGINMFYPKSTSEVDSSEQFKHSNIEKLSKGTKDH